MQFLRNAAVRRFLGGAIVALGIAWIVVAAVLLIYDATDGRGSVRFRFDDVFQMFAIAGIIGAGGLIALLGLAVWHQRFRGISALLCLGLAFGSLVMQAQIRPPVKFAALIPLTIFLLTLIVLMIPVRRTPLNQAGPVVRPDPLTDSNWRDWLLSSLRDTGVQPRDRFFAGVVSFVFIVIIIVAGRLVGYIQFPNRGAAIAFIVAWYAFGFLVVLPFFFRQVRQNAQARQRTAEDELMRPGSRRPILYLRSFAFDEELASRKPTLLEYVFQRPLANPEQELTYELRKCGPVIAIGRPDEKLPALGAARFYVTHDKWQEKVGDVVRVCQLVVLTSGVTEGLRWEIEHLVQSLDPQRLVLWCHPHLKKGLSAQEREGEWRKFVEMLGNAFPHSLPQTLGDTRFIHFDAGFRPIAVAPPDNKSMRKAIRAVLAAKGLPKPDPVARAARNRKLKLAGAVTACWLAFSFALGGVAFWIRSSAALVYNDRSAFNNLASELYYAERGGSFSPGEVVQRIQANVTRSDHDWLIRSSISPSAVAKLRPTAANYAQAFDMMRGDIILSSLLFGVAPPAFAVADQPAARARLQIVNDCASTLRRFQAEIDAFRASKPPFTYSVDSLEKVVKARLSLLEIEAALLTFVVANQNNRTTGLYLDESSLTYRDRRLQAQATELLARRREAVRVLRDLLK